MVARLALVVGALAVASCSQRSLPPGIGDPGEPIDSGEGNMDAPSDGAIVPPIEKDGCVEDGSAPSPDAQGLCGNMFLDVTTDPPNLFFVIDRSGSMAEKVDGLQKYDAVATAAVALVRTLGSQANVGAAVFPARMTGDDGCAHGEVVYPPTPGDPINRALCGNDGPVTRAFSSAISLPRNIGPNGATPTASTLSTLLPVLSALKGRTYVLLATDGGPNCNYKAACSASKCIPNIEGVAGCSPSINCCDTSLAGPAQCLDDDGTKSAVTALFTAGIKTYVIGIPGSAPYAALLNDLALAGGTARVGAATAYYDVEHIAELDDVLATIGATVTQSCNIRLAAPPPDAGLVNVYFDGQSIKYGPNGWLWGSAGADASSDAETSDAETSDASDESAADASAPHTEIELVGSSCDLLKSGKIRRLQVVFGCPTDIPR